MDPQFSESPGETVISNLETSSEVIGKGTVKILDDAAGIFQKYKSEIAIVFMAIVIIWAGKK